MLKKMIIKVMVITLVIVGGCSIQSYALEDEGFTMYDSWYYMVHGEDDEVRDMYGMEEDENVNIFKIMNYKLTKPFTDFVNDITGSYDLSYGAGGAYLRDAFNIFK